MIEITELEQAHIDELKAEIAELEADIEALKQPHFDDDCHEAEIDRLRWQVEALEAELAELEPTPGRHFVTFYTVTQQYGGPEEGGWWYDAQEPTTEMVVTRPGKHNRWDCEADHYEWRDCPDCTIRGSRAVESLKYRSYAEAAEAALWLNHARDPRQNTRDGLVVAIVEREPYTSTRTARPSYE